MKLLFPWLFIACALAARVEAADHIVFPGGSIQAAIDGAANGDRVLVQPGTYNQAFQFNGKLLEVRSVGGPLVTTLDGTGIANSIVRCDQGEGLGTKLVGFTLRNGNGRGFPSSFGQDFYGGAIFAGGGTKLAIEDCRIVHNGWSSGAPNNCTFGGGVFCGSSQITLTRCVIADNFAWACGGGTLVDGTGSMTFDRCTVVSNVSTNFFGQQGGIGMANDGDVFVRDCIVYGNYGNQIDAFGAPYNVGCVAVCNWSLVQGGFAGTGNVNADPLFTNLAALDVSLTAASPAINVGDPAAALDADGSRRDLGAQAYFHTSIVPFCFGDGSVLTCPCGNDGAPGRGCANTINGSGALLSGSGVLGNDALLLNATGTLATSSCVFLQGTLAVAPVAFGDGLRCTGGTLKRIAVKSAVSGGVSYPVGSELGIRARSAQLGDNITAGSVRRYQVYYRDPTTNFCPAPVGNTWNVTNGVEVSWP